MRKWLSSLCILSIACFSVVNARESFEFSLGDKISVLSDKAFRKTKGDYFEAVGNVVITHKSKALYGEKASMSMLTGDVEVIGNVRYVTPGMTLYGAELFHNLKTGMLTVKNARVMSDNYVVLGKKLSRISKGYFEAEDAEYTTCKDCPESWSVFGKKVYITMGEYIRIHHALIKANGVAVMYIPYIILPIKKKRETGLLFPSFGLTEAEGVRFQQPWFWAISEHSDMTLTPSVWGSRGFGDEFQYRKVFGEKKWFEINSLQISDRIYRPEKKELTVSGDHYFRHFSEYEHRFAVGNNLNHHFYYNDPKDLDVVRDFQAFSESRVKGSDFGGGGFIDYRTDLFSFGVEGHRRRNLLYDDTLGFDESYVQILPKFTFSSIPFSILHSDYPLLQNISTGIDSDLTIFKQTSVREGDYIRNARRLNFAPYINWSLGTYGPLHVKTSAKWDNQYYQFPHESERKFTKKGIQYESEVSFEIEKIFGLAYKEEIEAERLVVPAEEVKVGKVERKVDDSGLIGELPSSMAYKKKPYEINKNSYRHSQEFKVKHYFLSDQKTSGSDRFRRQIRNEAGLFDQRDTIKEKEHELSNASFRSSLPTSNTVELQWNNSLISKTSQGSSPFVDERYLRNNFIYSRAAYFNVSQGYDLNVQSDNFKDHLTRLYVGTGMSFKQTSISASEYYFYNSHEHITNVYFRRNFANESYVGANYVYNSFSTPVNKRIGLIAGITPINVLFVSFQYDYDINKKQNIGNTMDLTYKPDNNCWRLMFQRRRSLIDTRYSINFLVNFNDNSFAGLGGQ